MGYGTAGPQPVSGRNFFPGECNICHKWGHKARDCTDRKPPGAPQVAGQAQQAAPGGRPHPGTGQGTQADGKFQHISARTRSKEGAGGRSNEQKQGTTGAKAIITSSGGPSDSTPTQNATMPSHAGFTPVYYPNSMLQAWGPPGMYPVMQQSSQPSIQVGQPQYVVSQNVGPQCPQPTLQTAPAGPPMQQWNAHGATTQGQQPPPWQQDHTDNIPYKKVAVIQEDERQATLLASLTTEPHIEHLVQHERAKLSLPNSGVDTSLDVEVLLDTGAGVTAISEALLDDIRTRMPGRKLIEPAAHKVRVETATGEVRVVETQTTPMQLTVESSLGPVNFTIPFVVLPGTSKLVILGQKTLKAVLGINIRELYHDELRRRWRNAHGMSAELPPLEEVPSRLQLTVEAFWGSLGTEEEEEQDEITTELVEQGPRMFMAGREELWARQEALWRAVDDAERSGLSPESAMKLRDIVLNTHADAFRRALVGEPPARVEPMQVTLKPGSTAVQAKPRVYPPTKAKWLATHMGHLTQTGMVYPNFQAIYGSVAMAIPKGENNFRLVADYRAVNATIEPAAFPMPNLESMPGLFAQAQAFCTLDLLQGYWQMPLDPQAQELFTMVTTEGLYTPTRVPQGVLNATAYFQGVMQKVLSGLVNEICLVWVDDVVIWGNSDSELLERLERVLTRLMEHGLYAAAHKAVFYREEVRWCGKLYSGRTIRHDPERVQGLTDMRRPETARELQQFLCAINWMRTSLPGLAQTEKPLQDLLQRCLRNTTKTRRAAAKRVITEMDWSTEIQLAWKSVKELVEHTVSLSHRQPGRAVLMFPDASDLFWGSCITQVPMDELERGCPWRT